MNSFIESSDIKSHMKTSRNEYMKEKQKRSTLKSFVKNQEQICKTNLQIYNDSLKKDNLQYGDMKQTLKTFLMGYEHILIQKEKEKAQIKDTKYSTPFTELVNQYSQKGYKIPNLSRHHNLFKPSIILTDNKKTIDRYFKEAKKNKKNFLNNKEYKYMDKLDECVHIKLREGTRGGFFSNLDHHSSNFSFNTYEVSEENEKVSPLVKMENERKQKKLIKKENEELQKYNDIISNCINDYEKEWGSSNNTITINSNNNGNATTKHVSPFKKKNNVTTPSSTRHVLFKRSFTKEFNYNTHANTNNNNNNINSSTHNKTAMTVSKYVNNSIARTNIIKPNINAFDSSDKTTHVNSIGNSSNNTNRSVNTTYKLRRNIQSSNNINPQFNINDYSTIENESNITLPSIVYSRPELSVTCEGSNDPSHFFKVIRYTKRKVFNYNLDKFKTMAIEADKAKRSTNGKYVIEKMITLDKTVDKLDKELIKAIEMGNSV